MLEIKNLDFGYKTQVVFKNISLTFEKGSIYGLLGENGVGKTTLLKLISGLQNPSAGTCTVDGVASFNRWPETLQKIFFISEDFAVPEGTPVNYIHDLGMFYPNYDEKLFFELCNEMEVYPERKYGEMSFGQQKKCLIATALSLNTDYLLLDEPTNGLDIPSKTLFRQIITKHANEDRTIIISTHQVKDVENLIDPIIILDRDEVLLKASFREITEKLYFNYTTVKDDEALYSEIMPGGFVNICRNPEGLDSQVNIEALFNTVMHNKQTIKELFNK
ncbi:MAG: ATP-binding cassette domain-containing protein [Bacteroidales bacterium]|nr:ATP-binding cassette domain-containing protein [Bacteroidales bacterium]